MKKILSSLVNRNFQNFDVPYNSGYKVYLIVAILDLLIISVAFFVLQSEQALIILPETDSLHRFHLVHRHVGLFN